MKVISAGSVGGVPVNIDGISLLLTGTALLLGALVVIFSMPYMAGEEGEEKYYALMPLMVGTIIGLGSTNDLFNLWVWFETMTVASYLLVAFYTHDKGALEAGVKYLVQSAVGSVLVLMAIAMVFSQVHTLQLDVIAAWDGVIDAFLFSAGALVCGRFRGEDGHGPNAHLAAGCAFSGAEWDQRHAFRGL